MLISGITQVAAASANNNIFQGTYIEVLPADGVLEFGFTSGDVAGITAEDVELDILCGMELIANNFQPLALGVSFRAPAYPGDFQLSCPAVEGDRIIGKVRNLDAAAILRLHWAVMFHIL